MRSYWPGQTDDKTGVSDYLNRVHKYVVSSRLEDSGGWEPTTILRRLDDVRALKAQPGADTSRRAPRGEVLLIDDGARCRCSRWLGCSRRLACRRRIQLGRRGSCG